MERMTGLEPASSVWKTEALPIRRHPHVVKERWRPWLESNQQHAVLETTAAPCLTANVLGQLTRVELANTTFTASPRTVWVQLTHYEIGADYRT